MLTKTELCKIIIIGIFLPLSSQSSSGNIVECKSLFLGNNDVISIKIQKGKPNSEYESDFTVIKKLTPGLENLYVSLGLSKSKIPFLGKNKTNPLKTWIEKVYSQKNDTNNIPFKFSLAQLMVNLGFKIDLKIDPEDSNSLTFKTKFMNMPLNIKMDLNYSNIELKPQSLKNFFNLKSKEWSFTRYVGSDPLKKEPLGSPSLSELENRRTLAWDLTEVIISKMIPTWDPSSFHEGNYDGYLYYRKNHLLNFNRGFYPHRAGVLDQTTEIAAWSKIEPYPINFDFEGNFLIFLRVFEELLGLSSENINILRKNIPQYGKTKIALIEDWNTPILTKISTEFEKEDSQGFIKFLNSIEDFSLSNNKNKRNRKKDNQLSVLYLDKINTDEGHFSTSRLPLVFKRIISFIPTDLISETDMKLLRDNVLPEFKDFSEMPQNFNDDRYLTLEKFLSLSKKKNIKLESLTKILDYYNQNRKLLDLLTFPKEDSLYGWIENGDWLKPEDLKFLRETLLKTHSVSSDLGNIITEINRISILLARASVIKSLYGFQSKAEIILNKDSNYNLFQPIPKEILDAIFEREPIFGNNSGYHSIVSSHIIQKPPEDLLLLPEFSEFVKEKMTSNLSINFQNQFVFLLTSSDGQVINLLKRLSGQLNLKGTDLIQYKSNLTDWMTLAKTNPDQFLKKTFNLSIHNPPQGAQNFTRTTGALEFEKRYGQLTPST